MGADSKIEWCDHTFNPWIGCTKVSEGCKNCYAEKSTRARVLRSQGQETWGQGALRALTSDANWRQPLLWNKRAERQRVSNGMVLRCWGTTETVGRPETRMMQVEGADGFSGEMTPASWEALPRYRPRVFCASLADWLDEEVPGPWLARLLELIHQTPNLDWLLLTKRPHNWRARMSAAMISLGNRLPVRNMVESWTYGFPPENVWIGTTVENQARAEERVPTLLKIPAVVRFLSCEPLLGAVDLRPYLHRSASTKMCPLCGFSTNREEETTCPNDGATMGPDIAVDWVIAGGESGPGARPMHPDWARSLRDQCQAAGVAFLFKQWGEWASVSEVAGEGVHQFFDDGATVRRVGKKTAGRLLDGREWSEVPGGKGGAVHGV